MKKVLVIDDELEFVEDFAKLLEVFGYKPLLALNGETAFKVIKNEKPDIIICDYKLPDMEGDRILKETKKAYPEIKIVMLTAYFDEAVAQRFRDNSADEVIFKPINTDDIEKLLGKL